MMYDVRDVRDSEKGDEFKQDTLQAKGQLIAPELSISGKIIQRNIRYDNNKQQVEYYFQLQLTSMATGLRHGRMKPLSGNAATRKTSPGNLNRMTASQTSRAGGQGIFSRMKLAAYKSNGVESVGVLTEKGIVDIPTNWPGPNPPRSIIDILSRDAIAAVKD